MRADEDADDEIGRIWGSLNELAHHGNSTGRSINFDAFATDDFDRLVDDFERIMLDRLMHQIDVHHEIDAILAAGPDEEIQAQASTPSGIEANNRNQSQPKLSEERVRELIALNPDSRQYFFAKADERWLDWLWKNNLLMKIHQKVADPKQAYRTPELHYLSRAVDKNPARVADIMLEVSSPPNSFNRETLDQFLWICNKLPADQLARMVPKIHAENWVKLMATSNDFGFEYERMLKVLSDVKDYDSVLLLAEIILSVRTKEEIQKSSRTRMDDPFFLEHLEYTKVFEHLGQVDDAHLEKAFALALKTLGETTLLGDEEGEGRTFKIKDNYHLYDVDFFTLEPGQKEHDLPHEEVRELAAVGKVLLRRLLDRKCGEEDFVRRIYNEHVKPLPDSRTAWRFQLYVFSLCPKVFKPEIKEQIFRIFAYEMPSEDHPECGVRALIAGNVRRINRGRSACIYC